MSSFKVNAQAFNKKFFQPTAPTLAPAPPVSTKVNISRALFESRKDEYVSTVDRFYDDDVMKLMKDIREGVEKGDVSQVTIRSLDDIPPTPSFRGSPAPADQPPQETIGLSDLNILKVIGRGRGGHVYLAKDYKTGKRTFALKVIKKDGQSPLGIENILSEQRALARLVGKGDEFLQLVSSWHDSNNFYVLTPFYPGWDLAYEMILSTVFEPERTRTYTAELVKALEKLHEERIIHRDIKPNNILFRPDGHLVLADFGMAKVFEEAEHRFAKAPSADTQAGVPRVCSQASFAESDAEPEEADHYVTTDDIGTPMYMAPEMFGNEEYSFEVDFWAVGVILYKMVTGRLPFGTGVRLKDDISKSVINDPCLFSPHDKVDAVTKNFITALLRKDPKDRLKLEQIKAHLFFAGIDWAQVGTRELPMSWRPMKRPVPSEARPDLPPILQGLASTVGRDFYPGYTFMGDQSAADRIAALADIEEAPLKPEPRTILSTAYEILRKAVSFTSGNVQKGRSSSPSFSSSTPSVSVSATKRLPATEAPPSLKPVALGPASEVRSKSLFERVCGWLGVGSSFVSYGNATLRGLGSFLPLADATI